MNNYPGDFAFDAATDVTRTLDCESRHDEVARLIARHIDAAVASAIAAEREACAKIAEVHMHSSANPESLEVLDRIASYSNKTCLLIAAAIRNRGTT